MAIEKFNQSFLFFSNKVEALFDTLKTNLFGTQDTVFSERVLLFPTREMEKWVMLRLAKVLGIAAGFKTYHLNKAISVFAEDLFLSREPFFLPDEFELTLKLEELISESLNLKNSLFEPLQRYIRGKEKRVVFLARRLATLFQKYGIYGRTCCEKWEKNPQDWQELLWKMTFDKWDYPLKILPSLELKKKREEISVHLFSFSHLSPLHFHFFQKISQMHKVYFYQLSPCLEFWSDLPSKRQAALDETLLFDSHPLLAFTGKVGREMAKLIEDAEEVSIFENYQHSEGNTTLEKLQENLLLMKQEKLADDSSIEIHVSKTEMREVENLYNFILNQIHKKGYQPNDFLVLAPDIAVYEPFIRAIFDNPQIADIQTLHKNRLVEGFFLLLQLNEKRWSATSVLQLFDHPHFQKKMGWCKEDVLLIRDWIEKTGIRWGLDKTHRDFLLKESFCTKAMQEDKATWKKGIDLLLEKLALPPGNEKWIDFTSAELLGECAQILESLAQDLAEIKIAKNLNEWAIYFLKLVETYFAKSEENEFFAESLNRFSKASAWFQKKYPFQSLLFLLKEWMGKVPITLNSHILSSVSFCSILPMRAIPAKVICLIGMNESVFPRKDVTRSMDLLWKQKGGDFSPSKTDFDRYLFLEAILSARDVLMLSYLDNDTAPSPLVTELQRGLCQKKIVLHPAKSHDISYFDQKVFELVNFSQKDYELAKRFRNKKEASSFFVKKSKNTLPQGDYFLDVNDLNRVLRSPLKPYFVKQFGCSFHEEVEVEDEESFTLSALKKNEIMQRSLKEPLDRLFDRIEEEEGFPLGMFGRAAKSSLVNEIYEVKENLNSFVFCTVEMVLHEKKSYFDERGIWRTPALQLDFYPNAKVTIGGKIEGVYEHGLLSLNKCSFSNALKVWPFFLASNLIALPPNCHMEGIFFAKDNVFKKRFLSQEEVKDILSFLVQYYFLAEENPSPLFLEWMELFLKQDENLLQKKATVENVYDPLLKWALAGRSLPNFKELVEEWGQIPQQIFKGMKDAWF